MRYENRRSAVASRLAAAVAVALVMLTAACANEQRYIESLSFEQDGDQVGIGQDEGAPALLSGEYELVISCDEERQEPVPVLVHTAGSLEYGVTVWSGTVACGETRLLQFEESEPGDYMLWIGAAQSGVPDFDKVEATLTRVG